MVIEAADALERITAENIELYERSLEQAKTIMRLTAERDVLKEGLDGWHARFLDVEVERDALAEADKRLRDEVGNLTRGLDHYRQLWSDVCDENQGLRNERDALKADAERLSKIAYLIGSIFVHGNFVAETANERELQNLLIENGTFWNSLAEFDAAIAGEKHD